MGAKPSSLAPKWLTSGYANVVYWPTWAIQKTTKKFFCFWMNCPNRDLSNNFFLVRGIGEFINKIDGDGLITLVAKAKEIYDKPA